MTPVDISVVIPVYNEEENLPPLIEELEKTLTELGRTYEVICVNDCSSDGSVRVVEELQQKRTWLRLARPWRKCRPRTATRRSSSPDAGPTRWRP